MKKKLRFYGADTYLIPHPKPDQFTYQKPFFQKINNKLNIRSHILSKNQGKLSNDKSLLYLQKDGKCVSVNPQVKKHMKFLKS